MALAAGENKERKEKKVHKVPLVQEGGPVSREHVVSKEIEVQMAHQVHKVSVELTVYQDSPVLQVTLVISEPPDTQVSQA